MKFSVAWSPKSHSGIETPSILLGKIVLTGAIGGVQSVVISGIPIGAVLTDGRGHVFTATADKTSVNVGTWDLSTLRISPTNSANFGLTVTAVDLHGEAATATQAVTVNPL